MPQCSRAWTPAQGPLDAPGRNGYVPPRSVFLDAPRHYHPVPDAPPIPAFLPLSLLEALRNLDTPVEDGLEILARDIVSRRLGLSDTVAAQIERYRQAAGREAAVTDDELVSVLRLVGRR